MTVFKQYLLAARKRKEQAERLKKAGKSMAEIGRIIGVSRQRVHQMLGRQDAG